MSHEQFPGSIISKTAPTVVGPTGAGGGSASGIWTMDQVNYYIANGTWPRPPQLYGWGQNDKYQLGLNNTTNYSSPKQVGSSVSWSVLGQAASGQTFMGVRADGTLWGWGYNLGGNIGLGNTTVYIQSPTQVGALTTWASVAPSTFFTVAVRTNGTLWSWGRNTNGQLGLNNTTNYSSPKQIGALTTWASVAAGSATGFAIKTDGTLWVWGGSSFGQTGLGNTTYYSSPKQVGSLTNWSKISADSNSVLAIKTDGTLWSWGYNVSGELGLGNTTNYSSPKQVGSLTNWSRASSGIASAAIKTNGTLWTWGFNFYGTLGLNNKTYYSSPKQVGSLTNWSKVVTNESGNTLAIKTDGTLWAWGFNSSGELGLGNRTNYSSPKQVGLITTWNLVSSVQNSSFGTNWG